VLEDRLRQDVISELNAFGGRLLLHTETSTGSVVPVWESASPSSIETIKDVLAARKAVAPGVELVHARIPLTAERPPDFSDIADLMDIVTRTDGGSSVPVVLNCQLGRGRSTLAPSSFSSWIGCIPRRPQDLLAEISLWISVPVL
jgi:hypothetical protein